MTLDGEDLLKMSVDERARKGIFMAFQSPPEVPGVVASEFYRASVNARSGTPVGAYAFRKEFEEVSKRTGFNPKLASRNLNAGYSGGEKKRNEVLQMLLLQPELAFLDEIDSGLDVDALALISDAVKSLHDSGTTFIMISHYDRLYKLVRPERTAVIVNGTLAEKISANGYYISRGSTASASRRISVCPTCPDATRASPT